MVDWGGVEAVALVVLAVITAFYAWSTQRIVKETVKDRRVRRIEKALEEFYYPLLEVKDLSKYPYPPDYMEKLKVQDVAIPQEVKPYGGHEPESRKFWFDVNRHRYLAERKIIKVLDSFFQYSYYYWAAAPTVEMRGELNKVHWDLIAEVKKDVESLKKKLERLHKPVGMFGKVIDREESEGQCWS